MTFDNEEIDMLLTALDELDTAEAKGIAMNSMIGLMLSKSESDARARLKADKQAEAAMAGDAQILSERITVLKSKLIQLRPAVFKPASRTTSTR